MRFDPITAQIAATVSRMDAGTIDHVVLRERKRMRLSLRDQLSGPFAIDTKNFKLYAADEESNIQIFNWQLGSDLWMGSIRAPGPISGLAFIGDYLVIGVARSPETLPSSQWKILLYTEQNGRALPCRRPWSAMREAREAVPGVELFAIPKDWLSAPCEISDLEKMFECRDTYLLPEMSAYRLLPGPEGGFYVTVGKDGILDSCGFINPGEEMRLEAELMPSTPTIALRQPSHGRITEAAYHRSVDETITLDVYMNERDSVENIRQYGRDVFALLPRSWHLDNNAAHSISTPNELRVYELLPSVAK